MGSTKFKEGRGNWREWFVFKILKSLTNCTLISNTAELAVNFINELV